MTPERQSRLNRQVILGRDSGFRLRLTWDSGFTVTVHSWEAVSAIMGVSKDAMRQYWYQGKLAEGYESQNPSTGITEKCWFEELAKARRGPPMDPNNAKRRERAYLNDRLRKAEKRVLQIKQLLEELK